MSSSWILHDMIRVNPQTGHFVEKEVLETIEQYTGGEVFTSPRNAYLAMQLIIRGDAATAQGIEIEVSALTGIGTQAEIAASQFQLYLQWYHDNEAGYIPDALIPWDAVTAGHHPFTIPSKLNNIPEQCYGAVWIDLYVPKDAAAGEYQGQIKIKTSAGDQIHVLKLHVLNTILSSESIITAEMNSYADSISNQYPSLINDVARYSNGSYFEIERMYYQLSHEHRAVFQHLPYSHDGSVPKSFAPEIEGKGRYMTTKDWSLFDEHFGPYLDGSAFKDGFRGEIPIPIMYLPQNFHWPADYTKFGTKGYHAEWNGILEEFKRHFTEKGWLGTKFEFFLNHKKRYKLFPYDGDETRWIWDEKINDVYYELGKSVFENKEGAQIVFRTDSSWCYGLHYEKYPDKIKKWVVNNGIFSWFPESVEVLRAHDCEIHVYGGAQALHTQLVGTAISALICVCRGIDGFTYWNTLSAGETWEKTPHSDGQEAMFYPAKPELGTRGPIPSIRLKVLRDSMQVADLMESWILGQEDEEGRYGRISPARARMQDLIKNSFGFEEDVWWQSKPDFLDKPPYEWTNQLLSVAGAAPYHVGTAPRDYVELRCKLWEILK